MNQTLELAEWLVSLQSEGGQLEQKMKSHIPWLAEFEDRERNLCIAELVETAQQALDTGNVRNLYLALDSWEATAENLALGYEAEPVDWLDVLEPVQEQ